MKKEKTIRTYQRRTKTGKVVTVKQHTAKYDAAEAMKEAAKKKGAGDELENLKKKAKPEKVKVEKPAEDAPDYGFTADEYKAWYHWDQAADPKNKTALKVEKALKKRMGTKAYNKYFDDLTDNYSARGHNKAFKALGAEAKVPKKDAKTPRESSKITTPNSIEEIAKAGLKRVSVRYGKGDKKSATYYTDGKQVYEPGEDGYLKKVAKNKMVPEARKLIDPPKSRASHKENSMGFSSLDWEASYGNGATGVDSDAAMRKIDKAARKYLGAKAYKKWAAYQDDSDDTGGSYKGFLKQLEKFKDDKGDDHSFGHGKKSSDKATSSSKGIAEKPRMHTVKTPKGTTTLPVMKTLGKVGETRYTYDSAGNIYKPGKAGGASHIKLSDKKATEILDKLNISSRKFSAQVKESFSKGTTPKKPEKPKSTAGVTAGASAVKYNGKTYMVTREGSVETSTGRKVGKTLSAKVLKEIEKMKRLRNELKSPFLKRQMQSRIDEAIAKKKK